MQTADALRVLLIEDNADHAEMILRHVKRSTRGRIFTQHATTLAEGMQALAQGSWDAILLDLLLPDSRGLETLDRVVSRAAELPVIVLTSLGDEALATQALQQGAQDYLVKDDFTTELLNRAVRYAIERKRIEDRLRKSLETLTGHAFELEQLNRRLEEQNRDLDEFNHMVSHDLREPIRHLMVFGQRLREHAGEQLNEKASQDLQTIHGAAQRMENSIAGLQILSQTSRQEMHRASVPLESCVGSAVADLQEMLAEKQATISHDALPQVVADAALLSLLLRHLLANAVKYCEGKPAVRVTAEQAAEHWVFGVRDNGIGVDPRYAERIFTAFRRLHSRHNYGGGSGLGLAICRKVVERHGGRIWVESNAGGGSHFRFTLSAEASSTPQSEAPATAQAFA
jgi:signal transduction histidine kinase